MAGRVTYKFLAIDKFSAVAKKMNSKTEKLRRSLNKASVSAQKFGKSIKKAGASLHKYSAAAAVAVGASLKAFGDLEKGVTNVATLLGEDDYAKFGNKLEQLSKDAIKLGFSIEDATQALFNNVSALGANDRSFKAFEVAQQLAIGGVTELSVSVSGIAAVMNAYGTETTSAQAVADSFFAAQKKGTTDVNRLAINVGKVAPIAKNLGVTFQELMATMAQLTQGGINTEESTTALKAVMNALSNPGKAAAKILKELGVPMGVSEVRARGLAGTLAKLAEVAEKSPDLLGKAIPNVRGLLAAASLDAKALKRIQGTIEDQTGLQEATAKQMKTFSRAMSISKGQLTIMFAEIGKQIAPAVMIIARAIGKMTKAFQALSPRTKKIIAWSIVFVAALSGILVVIGSVVLALTVIGVAVSASAAALATGIAVALAALVALGVWVYANWEKITGMLSSGWNKIKSFFGADNPEITATSSADINNKSTVDINVGVNAPKGVVSEVSTKSSGTVPLEVATNMAGAQ